MQSISRVFRGRQNATGYQSILLSKIITNKRNQFIVSISSSSFSTSRTTKMAAPGEKIVPVEEMRRFMIESMTTVGTTESHATQLANVLLEGDIRGHYSHGLNRLG
ncbi:unnamed protein product [Caenorhabditis angaria]|uniref:Malate dehydrogenase n=1 Tax=Caenorhabditis angaria TaxID=860376 RepID=A0A9P1IBN9_9PELO|nr:unnamed protein product [Caenorhabditis angaria]